MFFITKTKGVIDSIELRPIEQVKIFCAKNYLMKFLQTA
ncbi:MAG: hypothetical protein LBD84_05390 [Campylobacteraceae bacterium]|nr:hypothetical protein [Campylobacteraceae bacterium]